MPRKLGLLKDLIKIFLGSPGFGEDQGFLLKGRYALALLGLFGGCESAPQRGEENLALRVLDNGLCECVKLAEHGHLLLEFR